MDDTRWEHFSHVGDIGVRGLGSTREAVFEQAAAVAVLTGIDLPHRALACARIASDEDTAYLGAMCAVTDFAFANRQILTRPTRVTFSKFLPTAELRPRYDVSHNTCWVEEHGRHSVIRRGTKMKIPLQITFRGIAPSEAIEARIQKKMAKLDKIYDRIVGCRVVVETPHRRHHQGKIYHVRVDLTVPGSELVVNREPPEKQAHEDVYVAIRDAFNAAQRQLLDYVARHKGQIKSREGPPHGVVVKLFPGEGYGFLETGDGREIFFHRNSVINDGFDRLEIGAEVRFAEEQGDKGAQASTVSPIGKEGRHLA